MGHAALETCIPLARLDLNTQELRRSISLRYAQDGQDQTILLEYVAEGSEAWQAGLRAGQRLAGISDPNRNEVWELGPMSSMRFVRDALRMRNSSTISLDVDTSIGTRAADISQQVSTSKAESSGAAEQQEGREPRRNSVDALNSVLGTEDEGDEAPARQESVAERLARDYKCGATAT